MKPLERRVERLEQAAIGAECEAMAFDVRFIDPATKAETRRLVLNEDDSQTHYAPDGNGGWRQADEQA